MVKRTIGAFQNLMSSLFGERDRKRGIDKSLIWLQTELGELLEAYLENDSKTLREEVADVLAWLCSVCNLLNIDLETAAWEKYPNSCPKCESNPCECLIF